jgi:hypothetical protein
MLSLLLVSAVVVAKEPLLPVVAAAPEITWVGIDMTRAQFYIPESFTAKGMEYIWIGGMTYPLYVPAQNRQIDNPTEAFEAFTSAFNELFKKDQVGDLEGVTKKPIKVDVPTSMGPSKVDAAAGWFKSESKGATDTSDITPEIVAEMVKGYPAAPLGMAFIADRFSKLDAKACFWPVLYDSSYNVVWTKRMCGEVGGLGLRNYYYNPVKEVLDMLGDVRKKEW